MTKVMPILHNLPNGDYKLIACSHLFEDRYIVVEANYLTSDVVTGDVVRVRLTSDTEKPVLEIVRTIGRYRYIMQCRNCNGNMIAPTIFIHCRICKTNSALDVVWNGYTPDERLKNLKFSKKFRK